MSDLQNLIAQLQKKTASLKITETKKATTTESDKILFIGAKEDAPYLTKMKPLLSSYTCYLKIDKLYYPSQVKTFCQENNITKVLCSSRDLLRTLTGRVGRTSLDLMDYAGSLFSLGEKGREIEIVIVPPLKQLVTVAYASFMFKRYLHKLTRKEQWFQPPPFLWEILTPASYTENLSLFEKAFCIAVDIETTRTPLAIKCVAYTAYFISEHSFSSKTVVIPIQDLYSVQMMRAFNSLSAPKILQNGKYDCAYLASWGAPLYNYLFDTATLFHAWYSELPKKLGFLNAFFIREAQYWKDLADTSDLYTYYKYNALDTWCTGNTFFAMLLEAPAWALNNYLLEFPLLFPCHLSEMTGIKRNSSILEETKKQKETEISSLSTSLDTMLGVKNFNVNSPPQMKSLLKVLGCGDLDSADEKNLQKARFRHPLNGRILKTVIEIRKARKLTSTYLITEGVDFKGRVLYSLNPHGTDSSRLASREHHFWCGVNIQNIPRGETIKNTFKADEGFLLAEADLEQAESRDTAYISGEEALIEAVEHSPDFHSKNASSFFGVPFDKIYDAQNKKVLDKSLRDLAKRVNHGANYNMGEMVLVETMGEDKISQASFLLKLPSSWSYIKIAEYLLQQFHNTYPKIKSVYYKGVIREIENTSLLRSQAIHAGDTKEGWVRYCFGNPQKNKRDLNSYVSHPPQSLNAQTLNKAYLKVFKEICLHPEHQKNFRLLAQIHDSILFQYREGHEYLCDMVKNAMEIPVKIKGYDGVERTFTVPASVKKGGRCWGDLG